MAASFWIPSGTRTSNTEEPFFVRGFIHPSFDDIWPSTSCPLHLLLSFFFSPLFVMIVKTKCHIQTHSARMKIPSLRVLPLEINFSGDWNCSLAATLHGWQIMCPNERKTEREREVGTSDPFLPVFVAKSRSFGYSLCWNGKSNKKLRKSKFTFRSPCLRSLVIAQVNRPRGRNGRILAGGKQT